MKAVWMGCMCARTHIYIYTHIYIQFRWQSLSKWHLHFKLLYSYISENKNTVLTGHFEEVYGLSLLWHSTDLCLFHKIIYKRERPSNYYSCKHYEFYTHHLVQIKMCNSYCTYQFCFTSMSNLMVLLIELCIRN